MKHRIIIWMVILLALGSLVSADLNDGLVNYWYLDEASGTNVVDAVGNNNGTVKSGDCGVGTVGYDNFSQFHKSSDTEYTDMGDITTMDGATTATFAFILNTTCTGGGCAADTILRKFGAGSQSFLVSLGDNGAFRGLQLYIDDGINRASWNTDSETIMTQNEWMHAVVIWDGGDKARFYVNNTLYANTHVNRAGSGIPASIANSAECFALGTRCSSPASYLDAGLDEVAMWTRNFTATEVEEIYNNSIAGRKYNDSGAAPPAGDSTNPNVTLSNPLDAENFTVSTVTINITGSDETGLDNLSIYINGILNTTNSSPVNNSYWLHTLTFADGYYNISAEGCDTSDNCNRTSNHTIQVDTSIPTDSNVTSLTLTDGDCNVGDPFNLTGNFSCVGNENCTGNATFGLDGCTVDSGSQTNAYDIVNGTNSSGYILTILCSTIKAHNFTFNVSNTGDAEASTSIRRSCTAGGLTSDQALWLETVYNCTQTNTTSCSLLREEDNMILANSLIYIFLTGLTVVGFATANKNWHKVLWGVGISFMIMTLVRLSGWYAEISTPGETEFIDTMAHYFMFATMGFRVMLWVGVGLVLLMALGIFNYKKWKKRNDDDVLESIDE